MIEKKSLQQMTALYIILAVTTFTLTLGGLLLLRPNFTPSQSIAIEPSSERLPEVTTSSADETSTPDTSVSDPATTTPTINKPVVNNQLPENKRAIGSSITSDTQVTTPEQTAGAPQKQKAQAEPSMEANDEAPKKVKDTSLIGALLNVIGAIL